MTFSAIQPAYNTTKIPTCHFKISISVFGLLTSIVYIILLHKMYYSNTKILQTYNITNITYNSIVLQEMMMFQIDVGSGYCAINGILSLESSLLSDILLSFLMSY